jgi:aspartyl aminopeptidase
MTQKQLSQQFIEFLTQAKTPYHAVRIIENHLKKNGFVELSEKDSWNIQQNRDYFVTRSGSSLIAFRMGLRDPAESGFYLVGAHTDSPTLKLKTQPEKT